MARILSFHCLECFPASPTCGWNVPVLWWVLHLMDDLFCLGCPQGFLLPSPKPYRSRTWGGGEGSKPAVYLSALCGGWAISLTPVEQGLGWFWFQTCCSLDCLYGGWSLNQWWEKEQPHCPIQHVVRDAYRSAVSRASNPATSKNISYGNSYKVNHRDY